MPSAEVLEMVARNEKWEDRALAVLFLTAVLLLSTPSLAGLVETLHVSLATSV
jgi:hypothetical protein